MKWVVALALLSGCPENTPQARADDRLLARLKAEKDREARDGVRAAPTRAEPPPPNPLAELAARQSAGRPLPVPSQAVFSARGATLRVVALEATHTVGEGITVTTDDWFLKVTLSALGPAGAALDLSTATLALGNESFAAARDAQAAFKQPARATLNSKTETRLTLFFEVPEVALKPGLSLVVANPEGASSSLELLARQ